MSRFEIFVLIWMVVMSLWIIRLSQIVYVLAKLRLASDKSVSEAKKMLRWGLEQRRKTKDENLFAAEGRKALREIGEAQDE